MSWRHIRLCNRCLTFLFARSRHHTVCTSVLSAVTATSPRYTTSATRDERAGRPKKSTVAHRSPGSRHAAARPDHLSDGKLRCAAKRWRTFDALPLVACGLLARIWQASPNARFTCLVAILADELAGTGAQNSVVFAAETISLADRERRSPAQRRGARDCSTEGSSGEA